MLLLRVISNASRPVLDMHRIRHQVDGCILPNLMTVYGEGQRIMILRDETIIDNPRLIHEMIPHLQMQM